MHGYDCCCDCCMGMGSSSQRQGPFEFRDGLDQRAADYRAAHPEHADKYDGKGLIIFPGEYPSLPGVY